MTDNQLYVIKAIANKQWRDDKEDAVGFEHNGQWITNPWMDPSGRENLSDYMAVAIYGKEDFKKFCNDVIGRYDLGVRKFDAADSESADEAPSPAGFIVIGTITSWGIDDYSVEWLELPGHVQECVLHQTDPYCGTSVRGTKDSVIEEIREVLV